MDPEIESIDWDSIESIYVEDDMYESFDAPKWVDLSAPDEPVDEQAWFCKPACKHPKTLEDFYKPTRKSKVKLLRSVSVSNILPFRERNRRVVKMKEKETNCCVDAQTKESNLVREFSEESENNNPNVSVPAPSSKKPSSTSQDDIKKPMLRSTFSARNLFAGRDIVNQITEFCTKLTRKSSKKHYPPSSSSSPPAAKTAQREILGEL